MRKEIETLDSLFNPGFNVEQRVKISVYIVYMCLYVRVSPLFHFTLPFSSLKELISSRHGNDARNEYTLFAKYDEGKKTSCVAASFVRIMLDGERTLFFFSKTVARDEFTWIIH